MPVDHAEIEKIVEPNGYGVGVDPNPFARQCVEWERRRNNHGTREMLTKKIEMLFEPRFITPPETSEAIEALVTMSDARNVLEVGMHTGFTALHILRALVGKPGASLVSVDARPALDREFFARIAEFTFLEGWTPAILDTLKGRLFDLVFVDSDHTVEHSEKEMAVLWQLTRSGTIFLFHDVPEWQTPDSRQPHPLVDWLNMQVTRGIFTGGILPTAEQLDCASTWGPGYPPQCSPHLGVFVRK